MDRRLVGALLVVAVISAAIVLPPMVTGEPHRRIGVTH